jgi:hypothetical protein
MGAKTLDARFASARAETGRRIVRRLERYAREVEQDGLYTEAEDARMFVRFIREEKWWRPKTKLLGGR